MVVALWVAPVGAQVDLSLDERRAAYCYGVAVARDAISQRNQLNEYLEGRGLGFYGFRPVLARQLREDIGKVGARDFQICQNMPESDACREVATCQWQTG
jgi:hypothetical protein